MDLYENKNLESKRVAINLKTNGTPLILTKIPLDIVISSFPQISRN